MTTKTLTEKRQEIVNAMRKASTPEEFDTAALALDNFDAKHPALCDYLGRVSAAIRYAKIMEEQWSTDSKATLDFCERNGFDSKMKFVRTAEVGGRIYVSGTLGKPEEWAALREACEACGCIYRGRNG